MFQAKESNFHELKEISNISLLLFPWLYFILFFITSLTHTYIQRKLSVPEDLKGFLKNGLLVFTFLSCTQVKNYCKSTRPVFLRYISSVLKKIKYANWIKAEKKKWTLTALGYLFICIIFRLFIWPPILNM